MLWLGVRFPPGAIFESERQKLKVEDLTFESLIFSFCRFICPYFLAKRTGSLASELFETS